MTSANESPQEPGEAAARGHRGHRRVPAAARTGLSAAPATRTRRPAPRAGRPAPRPAGRAVPAAPPAQAGTLQSDVARRPAATLPPSAPPDAPGPLPDTGPHENESPPPGARESGMDRAEAGEDAGREAEPPDGEPEENDEEATGGMFRSLRNRNYRLFLSGQIVSNTGTWMQRVAQDWLVLELTRGSGTALGVTIGLQFLPMLLFGLWGGVIADRYPKRRVLMLTQVAMGALALLLGLLAVTGNAQVWHVYLLAFGLGVATVVDNPTRQSFVVEMVGRRDLPNAIALNSAAFNGARLLGPAVAGVLIALIGTGPVFLLNAASFGAVLLGLSAMRTAELHQAAPVKRAKGQLREGLRYVRGRRDLMLVLILIGFLATFGMNFDTTVALMAKEVFAANASAFGLATSMLALGALSGALLAARRVARPRLRLLVMMGVLFGLLEVAAGLMPTYWSFLALLVPTGIVMMTITTAANATIQLGVAPEMRGRIMALYMLVFLGTNPVGAPAIGWLAEHFGARTGLVFGGLVSAAAALAVGALAARGSGWTPRPALSRLRRLARPERGTAARST